MDEYVLIILKTERRRAESLTYQILRRLTLARVYHIFRLQVMVLHSTNL